VHLSLLEATMPNSRRQLIQSAVSLAAVFSLPAPLLSGQGGHPAVSPQPLPSPNAPNPNFPQGMNGPGPTPPDQKAIDKQNQAELRSEVDKLYALASELKQELALTNTNFILSASFVKNTKQIEKIAKHVHDLAKG
jgi:hypothetical protein